MASTSIIDETEICRPTQGSPNIQIYLCTLVRWLKSKLPAHSECQLVTIVGNAILRFPGGK